MGNRFEDAPGEIIIMSDGGFETKMAQDLAKRVVKAWSQVIWVSLRALAHESYCGKVTLLPTGTHGY